jgi:hypothetical protein
VRRSNLFGQYFLTKKIDHAEMGEFWGKTHAFADLQITYSAFLLALAGGIFPSTILR